MERDVIKTARSFAGVSVEIERDGSVSAKGARVVYVDREFSREESITTRTTLLVHSASADVLIDDDTRIVKVWRKTAPLKECTE